MLEHRASGALDREPQQAASRTRRRAKLTSKQVDIIVRDYQAGLPLQQIADKFNIHRKTVHHNLQRRGVPPRGR
ncbi:helix-turn-helix domain-containing protein [Nesterenkonia flava]|uniref:Helix-turn-helix domain-containing protein n=1 Tax=Nesterenkonia flava TaxID=469799 RepID=A0ABU1FTN1_9MICC|nr:helix-turn-helix domain-containing protein [Nesterenkonia flava]MDR5711592.1 helix-turn-helix domain-containing protein [Nesterenkonia flava]